MDYLNNLENNFKEVCNECCHKGTEKCNYKSVTLDSLIMLLKNIKNNATYSIADGEKLFKR